MTAAWTSPDLSVRVETGGETVLFSADHGMTWKGMTPAEAQSMARGLCNAAERAEDARTESEHAA